MKKTFLFAALVILAVLIIPFSSCKDDSQDALQLQSSLNDSLLKVGGVMRYSVSVVPTGGTAFLKSTGSIGGKKASPAGAVVTASQNGTVVSDSAGASGIVVFDDMRIGNVSVTVSLGGHAGVMYIADLTPAGGLTEAGGVDGGGGGIGLDLSRVVRNAATLVPMFPISGDNMATVQGTAVIQSDLTNKETEIPVDAKISAQLDITDPGFNAFWETLGYNYNEAGAGRIIKMAFTDAVFTTTVGASGTYTINVPASGQPGVPIKLQVSDYTANQTLLMNTLNGQNVFGTQQISTMWGEDMAPSSIPTVPKAYATVSDPVGAAAMVTLMATAYAYVDNSNGVSSINLLNSGSGYIEPQGSDYYVCNITQDGVYNQGSAVAYYESGRISRVIVTNPGFAYNSNAQLDINRVKTPFYGTLQVSGTGAIIGVTIITVGEYRVRPTSVQISPASGSGALLSPNWTWNGNTWSVYSIDVFNSGTGYNNTNKVFINAPTGSDATYNLNLTTGTLISFAVTNSGKGYYIAPKVILSGGGGSGAAATAHIDNNTNKVDYITIDNPGSGYTSTPTVQLVVEDFISKAEIGLSINSMGVLRGATVFDGGLGYYTVPTVTILPSISGMGAGAQVIATINQSTGEIWSVNVIQGGANYVGANYPTSVVPINFPTTLSTISGMNYVRNLDFGTGERSILY